MSTFISNTESENHQEPGVSALLQSIKKLEPKAMEAFINQTIHDLHRYAISVIRNSEIAKDIVQEAYIRLWNYLRADKLTTKKYQGLLKWLCRTIQCRAIDLMRHEIVKQKVHKHIEYCSTQEGADIVMEIHHKEMIEQIAKHVEFLPVKEREVMKLYLKDHQPAQISKMLDKPVMSVKFLLHQARVRLRTYLN